MQLPQRRCAIEDMVEDERQQGRVEALVGEPVER